MSRFMSMVLIAVMAAGAAAFAGIKECQDELRGAKSGRPAVHDRQGMQKDQSELVPRQMETGQLLQMKKRLGLTDDQVNQLEEIRDEYRAPARERRNTMIALNREVMAIFGSANPDFPALREKVEKINDLQLETKMEMLEIMEKGYAVLTPEQKQKLAEMKGNRRERTDKAPVENKKSRQ